MNDLNIISGAIKVNKKAAFHNLGCKVNSYELDVMRQILRDEGYEEVPFHEKADVYVVNTCTVTNIADRKSRQMLHRAKKQNPDAVVVAVGCYVETDPERVRRDDAVDLVVGNNQKSQIGRILNSFMKEREEQERENKESDRQEQEKREWDKEDQDKPEGGSKEKDKTGQDKENSWKWGNECGMDQDAVFENMQLTSPGHTRAFIKIQDGCNQFCSYCIIPYARGRIRSREKGEILREVKNLVQGGVREIVLTGIHVSSYGLDFGGPSAGPVRFDPERSAAALLDLLTDLEAVSGLERIRMSSLEPRIMTEAFIRSLAEHKKVCPHFHLSLQSGCDETLRRMNRHYTTEEFAHSVELLRKYYDRPAITTDVIVGFPGETEAEFEQTCAFLEKIRFYEIHVFRYSRRNGTVAAKMKVQIPEPVKALRSDRLLAMTAAQSSAYRKQFMGEEETLLIEELCDDGEHKYWVGSTSRYVTGAVPAGISHAQELHSEAPQAQGLAECVPGTLQKGRFDNRTIQLSRGEAVVLIKQGLNQYDK